MIAVAAFSTKPWQDDTAYVESEDFLHGLFATSDGRRVLNRDVWRVTGSTPDGGLVAVHTRADHTVTITPEYAAAEVVLAYATTIAGAQGRTTDRGHVLVTPRTSAQALYVGMTRGRESNIAHVVCGGHDHQELGLGDRTPRDAFAAAMQRDPDGNLSEHNRRTLARRTPRPKRRPRHRPTTPTSRNVLEQAAPVATTTTPGQPRRPARSDRPSAGASRLRHRTHGSAQGSATGSVSAVLDSRPVRRSAVTGSPTRWRRLHRIECGASS